MDVASKVDAVQSMLNLEVRYRNFRQTVALSWLQIKAASMAPEFLNGFDADAAAKVLESIKSKPALAQSIAGREILAYHQAHSDGSRANERESPDLKFA